MMKLYIGSKGPVAAALAVLAETLGNCTVTGVLESADEVLCTGAHDAIDPLLAGRRVVLVQVDKGDQQAVDALEKNERFKESLTVVRWAFDESDGQTMAAFINHFAQ